MQLTLVLLAPEPTPDEQTVFDKLHAEYVEFVKQEQCRWKKENPPPNALYELMTPVQRQEVASIIKRWQTHITALAESWWKDRGYTIHWPDTDEDPCRYTKDD